MTVRTYLFIFVLLLYGCSGNHGEQSSVTSEPDPALIAFTEEMNSFLPERLDQVTFFDSLAAGTNHLTYYYSIHSDVMGLNLSEAQTDSLMYVAENRIPCTLWRPLFMQGVDVSFVYLNADREELLHFTRTQEPCQ